MLNFFVTFTMHWTQSEITLILFTNRVDEGVKMAPDSTTSQHLVELYCTVFT